MIAPVRPERALPISATNEPREEDGIAMAGVEAVRQSPVLGSARGIASGPVDAAQEHRLKRAISPDPTVGSRPDFYRSFRSPIPL